HAYRNGGPFTFEICQKMAIWFLFCFGRVLRTLYRLDRIGNPVFPVPNECIEHRQFLTGTDCLRGRRNSWGYLCIYCGLDHGQPHPLPGWFGHTIHQPKMEDMESDPMCRRVY